jgi:hypothetical protein
MNRTTDAERILDVFLAPEADRLPDRVLEAALAEIARTPQRRALRVPWRFTGMPVLSRATAVAAVVVAAVAVGGALYLIGPGPGPGRPTQAPTPSPSPSVSADLLDVSTWTAFTSSRYGFSAKYPPTFEAVPSLQSWRMPDTPGNMFDGFSSAGAVRWLDGVSALLPVGTTQADWYDEYRRDIVEDENPWEPETCFTPREDWESTTVDGVAADLRVACGAMEAFVFVEDRVYVFAAFGYDSVQPPTDEPGVSDEVRGLFELWLTTITLDPAAAVDPAPIPSPTST